jgi:beta-glucosidase
MRNNFPDDFLWGASTSAYQVEGGNFNSDWSKWEKETGHEMSGAACEHYERFRQDFSIAKTMGHNAHRLGLEWSRLEVEEGSWSEKSWDHYKQVLDHLSSLGIQPLLTLHHFTLPLWLAAKGGWLHPESPLIFRRFVERSVRELGGQVRYWITINEPNILAVLAYLWGQWPPCHKNFDDTVTVLKNMLRAHALSYETIKEFSKKNSMVGVAKAVTAFHPYSPSSPLDRISAHMRNRFHNHAFLMSLVTGKIELGGFKKEKLLSPATLDFIGLNYYFRQFIRSGKNFLKDRFGDVVSPPARAGIREKTDMGWEVYPEGLYETARSLAGYGLPFIVTENGIATTDDEKRKIYIKEHLLALLKAINEGIPVKGYLHWSLLDNFEWDSGYSKKFGLVEVDFKTQQRKPRASSEYYSKVIRDGSIYSD